MSLVQDRISERVTRDRLRLEVRRARRPFVLWLLLLAGALTALVLLLTKLDLPAPWVSQYSFQVAAADVTGVQVGNPVRIAGVQVGRVNAIDLRHGRPVLSVSIDPAYEPIYRDARVAIRSATPLQDMYLDVETRGSPIAGKVPSGGELAAAETISPVQFGQFLDIFDAGVRPRVTATINSLGQGLGDHGQQLREALIELTPFLLAAKRLNQVISVRALETRRLIHNFTLVNTELANRSNQLRGLIIDGSVTMNRLASVEAPLGQLIDRLPPMLRVLPPALGALDTASDQLTPAAQALLPVAQRLAPALAALRALSPLAQSSLAALDQSLPGLTSTVVRAGPVADQLQQSFSTLRPQAPQLNRATAALIPCETAVQKFFQWTMSVSKLYSDYGDMQRGLGEIGSQGATGLVGASGAASILTRAPTCSHATG